MFVKTFFIQTLWNYERLQNVGFLFILKPFLCRIYSDEGEKKEAFLRHVGFFNTHPYMVDLIAAIVVNMEEKASENVHGEKVSDINMIKDIMTAPLARDRRFVLLGYVKTFGDVCRRIYSLSFCQYIQQPICDV
jgi:PTS system mannose-specific IID component